jgi:two-component system cell cycle response regulator DivK
VTVVLVVDDNEKNRKLARDLLGAAGFEALEADTAAEGIALAAEHLPDVILMDLRLPDMDGTVAALKLGDDERTARIPVVAMSALPLAASGDWLEAAGFAGWLEKPIHPRTFAAQLSRFCAETKE